MWSQFAALKDVALEGAAAVGSTALEALDNIDDSIDKLIDDDGALGPVLLRIGGAGDKDKNSDDEDGNGWGDEDDGWADGWDNQKSRRGPEVEHHDHPADVRMTTMMMRLDDDADDAYDAYDAYDDSSPEPAQRHRPVPEPRYDSDDGAGGRRRGDEARAEAEKARLAAELSATRDEARASRDDAREARRALEQARREANEAHQVAERAKRDLAAEVREGRQKVASLEREAAPVRTGALDAAQAQVVALEAEVAAAKAAADAFKEAQLIDEKRTAPSSDNGAFLLEGVAELRARLGRDEAEARAAAAREAATHRRNEQLETEANAALELLEAQIREHAVEKDVADRLHARVTELEAELVEHREVEEAEQKLVKRVLELEAHISQQDTTLRGRVAELEGELAQCRGAFHVEAALTARCTELEADIAALNTAEEDAENNAVALRKRVAELEAEVIEHRTVEHVELALRLRVEELEAAAAATAEVHRATVQRLEAEVAALQEATPGEARSASSPGEAALLRRRIAELESDVEAARAEAGRVVAEKASSWALLEERAASAEALSAEMAAKTLELRHVAEVNAHLEQAVEEAAVEVSTFRAAASCIEQEKAAFGIRAELAAKEDDFRAYKEDLEMTCDALRGRLVKQDAREKAVRQELEALKAAVVVGAGDDGGSSSSSSVGSLVHLEGALKAKEAAIASLTADLEARTAALEAAEALVTQREREFAEVAREAADLRRALEAATAAAERQVEEAQAEVVARMVEEREGALARARADFDAALSQRDEVLALKEDRVDALMAEVAELQRAARDRGEAFKAELEMRLAEAAKQTASSSEAETRRLVVAPLEATVRDLTAARDRLATDLERQRVTADELRADLDAAHAAEDSVQVAAERDAARAAEREATQRARDAELALAQAQDAARKHAQRSAAALKQLNDKSEVVRREAELKHKDVADKLAATKAGLSEAEADIAGYRAAAAAMDEAKQAELMARMDLEANIEAAQDEAREAKGRLTEAARLAERREVDLRAKAKEALRRCQAAEDARLEAETAAKRQVANPGAAAAAAAEGGGGGGGEEAAALRDQVRSLEAKRVQDAARRDHEQRELRALLADAEKRAADALALATKATMSRTTAAATKRDNKNPSSSSVGGGDDDGSPLVDRERALRQTAERERDAAVDRATKAEARIVARERALREASERERDAAASGLRVAEAERAVADLESEVARLRAESGSARRGGKASSGTKKSSAGPLLASSREHHGGDKDSDSEDLEGGKDLVRAEPRAPNRYFFSRSWARIRRTCPRALLILGETPPSCNFRTWFFLIYLAYLQVDVLALRSSLLDCAANKNNNMPS